MMSDWVCQASFQTVSLWPAKNFCRASQGGRKLGFLRSLGALGPSFSLSARYSLRLALALAAGPSKSSTKDASTKTPAAPRATQKRFFTRVSLSIFIVAYSQEG